MKKLLIFILYLSTISFTEGNEDFKTIKGSVKEIETGKPITDAMIFLHVLDKQITTMTTTDQEGNFIFENISGKFGKITVNRIGYDGAEYGPMRLAKKTPKFKFELTPIPFSTDEVVITEEHVPPNLVRNGFYKRKDFGMGKYLDAAEIKKNHIHKFSQLLYRFPNFRMNHESGAVSSISLNGSPLIYLDGILVDNKQDIRNLINVESIAGIEVYRSTASAPIRYSSFGSSNGIILIWSK